MKLRLLGFGMACALCAGAISLIQSKTYRQQFDELPIATFDDEPPGHESGNSVVSLSAPVTNVEASNTADTNYSKPVFRLYGYAETRKSSFDWEYDGASNEDDPRRGISIDDELAPVNSISGSNAVQPQTSGLEIGDATK